MRAVVAKAYGPPESMVLEEWPRSAPDPNEVRVRVHSAGVTFADVLMAAGKHQQKPPLPFIPGSEFSGHIIDVGENITHVNVGDKVCGGRQGGVLAEEVTLSGSRVQKLPDNVDMDEAAVLRASYLTAWYSLVECGHLSKGETVLVLGAAGAVGIACCQLAKHFGAQVIASASTEAKRQFALKHNADHAIDTYAEDWRDQVRTLTGNRGLDVIVDPVGGEVTEKAFRALAYKGRHLMVGFSSGVIPRVPANLPLLKGASLVGVLAQYFEDREPEANAAAREKIIKLFASGRINPPIGAVYPYKEFVNAMTAVESNKVLGRVLVRMS